MYGTVLGDSGPVQFYIGFYDEVKGGQTGITLGFGYPHVYTNFSQIESLQQHLPGGQVDFRQWLYNNGLPFLEVPNVPPNF